MILAIESSCDESALALFDPARGLTGEWVHSQIALHREYGGVVPDLASREHLDRLPALLALAAAQPEYARVTQIAVTQGPGLAGCLALGIALGEALALARNLPLVGVNHLRGHVWSPFIALHAQDSARFWDNLAPLLPHLGLLVSGGNTLLYRLDSADQQNGGRLTVVNRTVDDAAGEALDKGAKLLGLPYPGGPLVEKLAASGDPRRFDFPRALGEGPRSGHTPFSFSGLKTSLRYRLEKMSPEDITAARADLCASYQAAVIDQLLAKTAAVLTISESATPSDSPVLPDSKTPAPIRSLGLSGGVANNTPLRSAFAALAARHHLPCFIAAPQHTGDNAAMIAFAAYADPSHTVSSLPHKPLAFEPSLPLVSSLPIRYEAG
jgi:N6-L-threonylcarbamoyladenine synthase